MKTTDTAAIATVRHALALAGITLSEERIAELARDPRVSPLDGLTAEQTAWLADKGFTVADGWLEIKGAHVHPERKGTEYTGRLTVSYAGEREGTFATLREAILCALKVAA